jgi:anti-anti-sigma factor
MSLTLVVPDSAAEPPAIEFAYSWTHGDLEACWVHVAGRLDASAVCQLGRALGDPQMQAPMVVLDLRRLSSIDQSGVHAVINASLLTREAGRRLVILHGPPNVERMFKLGAGVDALEIGDLDRAMPPVRALRLVDAGEFAS